MELSVFPELIFKSPWAMYNIVIRIWSEIETDKDYNE